MGSLTSEYDGRFRSNRGFDSPGRINSIAVMTYGYTYDQNDNMASKTQLAAAMSVDSETYSYDGVNRLTSLQRGTISNGTITSPTTSESWSLDALGNQKSVTTSGETVTRAISNQNQIESLSNSSTNLNYDANGNTLNGQTGQTYVYDAWNRLVKVTTPKCQLAPTIGSSAHSVKRRAPNLRPRPILFTLTSFLRNGVRDGRGVALARGGTPGGWPS